MGRSWLEYSFCIGFTSLTGLEIVPHRASLPWVFDDDDDDEDDDDDDDDEDDDDDDDQ